MARTKALVDVRSLARAYTESSIKRLAGIMSNTTDDRASAVAAKELLDRGWGKPAQVHTGDADSLPIRVTVTYEAPPVSVGTTTPAIGSTDSDDHPPPNRVR